MFGQYLVCTTGVMCYSILKINHLSPKYHTSNTYYKIIREHEKITNKGEIHLQEIFLFIYSIQKRSMTTT